jgi:DNA mismatch repair protein MutS
MAAKDPRDTPVMRQFHAAKAAHPDALLLFRMGDFYETFFEDAVVASRELDLTLTARNKGAVEEVPMAGVPHHAAAGYIARLVAKGFKVAICEQMADPSKTKGIVPREVVRVITPGLVTEEDQVTPRENHFLAAVHAEGDALGLALLDLSTGELRAASVAPVDLLAEILRAAPREVLLGDGLEAKEFAVGEAGLLAVRADGALSREESTTIVRAELGDAEAASALERLASPAFAAAARALRFARRCAPSMALPWRQIEAWDPREHLLLDESAQRHLELTRAVDGSAKGTLLAVLDRTRTAGGARLLRRRLLAPLTRIPELQRRLDAVELFVRHATIRSSVAEALERTGDLERLITRATLRQTSPRDLGALRDTLLAMPQLAAALAEVPDSDGAEVLGLAIEPLDLLPDLAAILSTHLTDRPPPLLKDGNIIREGCSAELDDARSLRSGGASQIAAMETSLRESTGIGTLKIKFTRVFGWYIEVTGRHLDRVPKTFRRKQTVAGGERYTTDELDDLGDRALHAEERETELEIALFRGLVDQVVTFALRLHRLAARLAEWDVSVALAEVAHRKRYVRPELTDDAVLELEESRHPVVEELAAAGQFVPNDVRLDVDNDYLWLVTGPNMAGKSTLMRQTALIVILAQMGSFVPAARARIGIADRVLSRVGASDNVARGESTFMVEMRETASILRSATRRSLVILDEIGRGTSTYDGLSIAWAVAEHLHDVVRCRALFATHYHELTELAKTAAGIENVSVSAREIGDDIVFLHKLTKGAASRSYGVAVARHAGIPESILARARAILAGLEAGAALPSGGHATLRGRARSGGVQLDFFAPKTDAAAVAENHPALETIRAVDPLRLSPMDALALITKLKELV